MLGLASSEGLGHALQALPDGWPYPCHDLPANNSTVFARPLAAVPGVPCRIAIPASRNKVFLGIRTSVCARLQVLRSAHALAIDLPSGVVGGQVFKLWPKHGAATVVALPILGVEGGFSSFG